MLVSPNIAVPLNAPAIVTPSVPIASPWNFIAYFIHIILTRYGCI
jgi:hypothetical protein